MGHSQQPSSGGSPESIRVGHELTDVKIWPLIQFAIMLSLVSAASMWMVLKLHGGMDKYFDEHTEPAHPMQTAGSAPAGPLLQENEAKDYQRFHAGQVQTTGSYAWVDQEADVVRVPIERAKELVLQEGLPHRATDK